MEIILMLGGMMLTFGVAVHIIRVMVGTYKRDKV